MTSNLEQQADELEALQSIYTEEEFSPYDNERPGGHFLAHIDLPPNFQVQYQLLGNKYKSKPSSSSKLNLDDNYYSQNFIKYDFRLSVRRSA
jgi:hypothetical protein